MAQDYDVIIIGGGIIGSSLAAYLASEKSEKLKIALVNSTNLGMMASQAAAGLLTPFQLNELENPVLKDFCFKSFEHFPEFLETITSVPSTKNIDFGYRQAGSLYLIFSNLEFAQKENEIKDLRTIEPKASFLSKVEVPKYEPLVTKDVIGAYHYPSEAYINNPKFLKAIYLYCIEKNVEFLDTAVKKLNLKNNTVENIVLDNGQTISAKKFVLCNGAWANHFLKEIFNTDETLIKPIKGEIIRVEALHATPLLQKIIFCSEGYILPRPATNHFETDSILIGSTSEEIDLEKIRMSHGTPLANTVSGISSVLNLFKKLMPNYKDYLIADYWAGLRPQTKDKLPIIGKIAELENLYCSLGHYRNGILMGPYSGKIVKDLILENHSEYNIEHFQIDRLLKPQGKEKLNRSLIPQN